MKLAQAMQDVNYAEKYILQTVPWKVGQNTYIYRYIFYDLKYLQINFSIVFIKLYLLIILYMDYDVYFTYTLQYISNVFFNNLNLII